MKLDQRTIMRDFWLLGSSFEEHMAVLTEGLQFTLQEDAEFHRDHMEMMGATEEDIAAEMKRWWESRIRRFRILLRLEWAAEKERRLRRRARRAEQRQAEAEEEAAKLRAELHEAKVNLEIERGLNANLKEQWYCRDCYGKRWDSSPN